MTVAIERPVAPVSTDKVITLQGDWAHFKLVQQGCAQNRGIRLFYFDGTIELVMPSRKHEIFAHIIGYLLTYFLSHQDLEFLAVGSADQEKAGESSAQPDQSYCIGSIKPIPDLRSVGDHRGARSMVLGRRHIEAVPPPSKWLRANSAE
jgi:Uma2 family endonuclease